MKSSSQLEALNGDIEFECVVGIKWLKLSGSTKNINRYIILAHETCQGFISETLHRCWVECYNELTIAKVKLLMNCNSSSRRLQFHKQ